MVSGHANEFARMSVNLIPSAKDAILGKNIRSGKIQVTIGYDDVRAWLTIADNAMRRQNRAIRPVAFSPSG